MTWVTSPASSGRGSARWSVTAVALLLIAAACLAVGLRGSPDWLAGPAAPQPTTPSAAGGPGPAPSAADSRQPAPSAADGSGPARSGVVGPRLSRSVPLELRIPAIDVAVSLSALGLNADRTVQVPTDYEEPGWFRLGPSPGQLGSAVILGHVDSHEGPAVFYLLRYLKAGDGIAVRLADGRVAHFEVSKVATYPNEQFPAGKVYASHGYSALHLVTCGGEFDTVTDSYQANVVVYASLEKVTSQLPQRTSPVRSAGSSEARSLV